MKKKREGEQIYYMVRPISLVVFVPGLIANVGNLIVLDLQEGHEDGINCMAVSADDSFLVSGETTVHQEDESP